MKSRFTFYATFGKVTGYIDVYGILVVDNATNVAHGSVDEQFLLLAQLPPLLRLGVGQRTWVTENLDGLNVEVTHPRDMDLGAHAVVGSTQITIEGDSAITLALGSADLFTRGEVLETIGKHVRVLVAEDERAELHDGDEAGEIEDFGVGITSVKDAGEVE